MEKVKMELISKIADRAKKMELLLFDKFSMVMDLECTDKLFNLRLEELLNADDFNFKHDIIGIQQHLNRTTKQMEHFFVPRFAGK